MQENSKEKNKEVSSELLLADLMLRMSLIEEVLFDKGFITKEDYVNKLSEKANDLANKIQLNQTV